MNSKFWSYRVELPPDNPTPDFRGTVEGWQTLSPGYRRVIWREFIKQENNLRKCVLGVD
jgi:hypothetical protein